jgi:cysteine desulfurase family protein (TIGR01976 family)
MEMDDIDSLRRRVRACYPTLGDAHPAFLDNAAGSMVPKCVVDAVSGVLSARGVCNSMPAYAMGRAQIDIKQSAHEMTALFVGAKDAAEIALGPSATAMSFRFAAALSRTFAKGDAVVISGLEHECNASPWRETAAEIRIWGPRWPEGNLDVADLTPLLADGRVRIVALTACSNAFGLLTPVREAAVAAQAAGALIIVDAVHASPHEIPDVQRDGLDAILFSPYKVFAPHLGCLYVRSTLLSTLDVPTLWFYDKASAGKFEYGTPPFEALAGWLASLRYLVEDVGGGERGEPITRAGLLRAYEAISALERPLTEALLRGLSAIVGVTIYGQTSDMEKRVGTVAFRLAGIAPAVLARRIADEHGVCVSSGHFYATLPVDALGLMPDGVVRVSIAHYNTLEEIARFINGVTRIAEEFSP